MLLATTINIFFLLSPHCVCLFDDAQESKSCFHNLSFEQARKKAINENKVVMVDFVTDWCSPCKMMDKTTWEDTKVIAWLGKNTIAIKVDAMVAPELSKKFDVSTYPTMLFTKPNGDEIARLIGGLDGEDFLQKANDILSGKSKGDSPDNLLTNVMLVLSKQMDIPVLISEKKYEQAFEDCKWLIQQTKFNGLKTGIELLAQLSEKFKPARSYLGKLKSDSVTSMRSNKATTHDVELYVAISQGQKTSSEMLALFDELNGRDLSINKDILQHFRRSLFDVLLKAKRYEDIVTDEPDIVELALNSTKNSHTEPIDIPLSPLDKSETTTFDKLPSNISHVMEHAERSSMIQQATHAAKYYRVLLAIGRTEEAHKLATRLLEKYEEFTLEVYRALAENGLASEKPIKENELQARKALELSQSENVEIVATLCRILFALEKEKESIEIVNKSLEKFDDQHSETEVLHALLKELQQNN